MHQIHSVEKGDIQLYTQGQELRWPSYSSPYHQDTGWLPSLVLNWIVVGKLENLYSNLSSLSSSLLLNQQCFTTGSTMIKWDRRSCTFWIDKVKFGQIGLFHQQLVSLLSPSLSLSPSLIYFHLHIIHFPSQWSKTRRKSARTVKRKLSTYWSLQHPKILILQYEFHMKLLFQSIAI